VNFENKISRSKMKKIWKSSSKSDRVMYIVAVLAGVPLAIYWDRHEKNGFLVLWHLLVIPFLLVFFLIILKGWIIGVFAINKDSDQKEISIGFPLILFLIGLIFKNDIITVISFVLGGIATVTWLKKKV
jgi:hypothetical protein